MNRKKGTLNPKKSAREPPSIKLEDNHRCSGCPMYNRNNTLLYCPVPVCIRGEINKAMK